MIVCQGRKRISMLSSLLTTPPRTPYMLEIRVKEMVALLRRHRFFDGEELNRHIAIELAVGASPVAWFVGWIHEVGDLLGACPVEDLSYAVLWRC